MTSSNKFDNIEYLASGNVQQQNVYALLTKLGIMHTLAAYQPLLVGTIPIDIAIDGSDLDIICCYTDADAFEKTLIKNFGSQKLFKHGQTDINGQHTVLVSFILEGWIFEIFGQPVPTKQQNGYRHMIVEHKLLQQHGQTLRSQVIALKQSGLKTEPAFAKALHIDGNPYQALLNL